MKRTVFLLIGLISLRMLHAQDGGLNAKNTFRNEYFTQIGFFKPLASSWKSPSEAFTVRPFAGYSVHFGVRLFDQKRPLFYQFSAGRRMTDVLYKMKQDYVDELSPDYDVRVSLGGSQGITDVNFGLGSRIQLAKIFYVQPACIFGIATRGNYIPYGGISSNSSGSLDSTGLKIEGGPRVSLLGDLGLSIELNIEAGVKLGKCHSLGFQGSFVQYGIGLGVRRPPVFSLHSARYHIYNNQKSYELNTSLLLKGYSLALTYHYSF